MHKVFTHYLITRFNVPVKNWEVDKAGNRVLDKTWIEHRLRLFNTYCAPTIGGQSNTNFTWLIYCDHRTEEDYLRRITETVSGIHQAEIRLVEDFYKLLDDLRDTVSRCPTPYIITSRLDNDDGLGIDFVNDVQANFSSGDLKIINFTKGILYDGHRHVLTEIRYSQRNHYGSLIETLKQGQIPLTVLGYPHGNPPEKSEIVNVSTRLSWLKIIHERNMASKTNGKPLLNNSVVVHFGLKRSEFPISYWATIIFVFRRLGSKVKRKWFTLTSRAR